MRLNEKPRVRYIWHRSTILVISRYSPGQTRYILSYFIKMFVFKFDVFINTNTFKIIHSSNNIYKNCLNTLRDIHH